MGPDATLAEHCIAWDALGQISADLGMGLLFLFFPFFVSAHDTYLQHTTYLIAEEQTHHYPRGAGLPSVFDSRSVPPPFPSLTPMQ